MTSIQQRLEKTRQRIQALTIQCNRDHTPALMAVSKFQPEAAVLEAIKAGQRLFGENRAQEALQKWPAIKAAYPEVELHMIGSLQTNKVKDVFKVCDAIDSVDRPALAEEIARQQQKTGRKMPCLIQVNIGQEAQKAGVAPEELPALLACCHTLGVQITGLMCIPPQGQAPLPYFHAMQALASRYGLTEISMGMSGDFEAAILAGSTCLRVGTGIFGLRDNNA